MIGLWRFDARPAYRERFAGLYGLRPGHHGGLDLVAMRIERLRHLICNGYHQEARNELLGMRHMISGAAYMRRHTHQLSNEPLDDLEQAARRR